MLKFVFADIEVPALQGIVRSAPLTFEAFYVPALRKVWKSMLRAPVDQEGRLILVEIRALLGARGQLMRVCFSFVDKLIGKLPLQCNLQLTTNHSVAFIQIKPRL